MREKYEWDCENCVYLGDFIDEHGVDYDLYYCPQAGRPTVISLESDGRYGSGLCFMGRDHALGEAARRAVEKGVLSRDENSGMYKPEDEFHTGEWETQYYSVGEVLDRIKYWPYDWDAEFEQRRKNFMDSFDEYSRKLRQTLLNNGGTGE